MGSETSWEVVATPAERWFLARFLLRDGLKFKGPEAMALWRFRCDLGLVDATEAALEFKGAGNVDLANDRATKSRFTLTAERAEFFERCIAQVEPGGAELAAFQRLHAQILDKKPSADIDEAKPYDPTKENWTPTLAPTIRQPGKLIDVLLDCVDRSDSWAEFRRRYKEEVTPGSPGKPAGRLAETAQA